MVVHVSYLSHACTIIIGPYDKAGRELASGIVVSCMYTTHIDDIVMTDMMRTIIICAIQYVYPYTLHTLKIYLDFHSHLIYEWPT